MNCKDTTTKAVIQTVASTSIESIPCALQNLKPSKAECTMSTSATQNASQFDDKTESSFAVNES